MGRDDQAAREGRVAALSQAEHVLRASGHEASADAIAEVRAELDEAHAHFQVQEARIRESRRVDDAMVERADLTESLRARAERADAVIAEVASLHREKHGQRAISGDQLTGRVEFEPYVICDYDKTGWPCKTSEILSAYNEGTTTS